MKHSEPHQQPTLVFVYNAGSGLFNALADTAHKIFSPRTYQCQLCALTYSTFGMCKSWKQFLETLDNPFEFLHADELKQSYGIRNTPLPAIFKREGDSLRLWIDADAINACRTLDDLKALIKKEV
jgi:hypothetical protein